MLEGGCSHWGEGQAGSYSVSDPRKLRHTLDTRLLFDAQLCGYFLSYLRDHLAPLERLQEALQPMTVTGPADCADSFIRVLLNVAPLQGPVAALLLERLPELDEHKQLQQRMLAQFRWLDHVVDSRQLGEKLLEVMPVCPDWLQCEIITFLPEVLQEQDYQMTLERFDELLDSDALFVAPVMEAVSNMDLQHDMQEHMVGRVLERLPSCEVEDLPSVVQFLVQHLSCSAGGGAAGGGGGGDGGEDSGRRIVALLRDSLHLVNPSDPRLAVVDHKQKGKAPAVGVSRSSCPEARLFDALRTGLQLNETACTAFMKAIDEAKDPASHRSLDLWLLLLFHALSPTVKRRKVEACLKRKLAGGAADITWLRRAVQGHGLALEGVFSSLVGVAQILAAHADVACQEAGSELYCTMFATFEATQHRQGVMRALHSHLGSHGNPTEVGAALRVLGRLAGDRPEQMLAHGGFLTTLLDFLDTYADDQLRQVFEMLGLLFTRVGRIRGVVPMSGNSQSRLEDELNMLLRKCLSSANERYRKMGVIGMVALAAQLGSEESGAQEPQEYIDGRCEAARFLLGQTLQQCRRSAPAYAFACDELTCAVRRGKLAKSVLEWLLEDDKVGILPALENTFAVDLEDGRLLPGQTSFMYAGKEVQCVPWLNLDGVTNPVAVQIITHLGDLDRPERLCTLYLCPLLRLLSAASLARHGSLDTIDALLGSPLVLPPLATCLAADGSSSSGGGGGGKTATGMGRDAVGDDGGDVALPPAHRRLVVVGLMAATNWLRELVNCYCVMVGERGAAAAAAAAAATQLQAGTMALAAKLRCRLLGIVQLEVLLERALAASPPGLTLPVLADPLRPQVAVASLEAKAGGKGARKGSKAASSAAPVAADDEADENDHAAANEASASGAAGTGGGGADGAAVLQRVSRLRPHFRPLVPQSLDVLTALGSEPEAFAAATYLVAEANRRLQHLTRKQGRLPWATASTAAAAPAGAWPAADVLPVLHRVAPVLRQLLDAAVNMQQAGSGAVGHWGRAEGAPAAKDDVLGTTIDHALTNSATEPMQAAPRLLHELLLMLRLLLSWQEVRSDRALLLALLRTLALTEPQQAQQQQQSASGAHEVVAACHQAVPYLEALCTGLEGLGGNNIFDQQVALLSLMRCVAEVGDQHGAPDDKAERVELKERVSACALSVLQQPWGEDLPAESPNFWKSRSSELSDLLGVHVRFSRDPVDTIRQLARLSLPQVPEATGGRAAQQGVEGQPALCGATLVAWYKVLAAELQASWCATAEQLVLLHKSPSEVFEGEALARFPSAASAVSSFLALVQVTKYHPKRSQLHALAVKLAGPFVDAVTRSMAFWSDHYQEAGEGVPAMVKELQKATKLVHVLCTEGKVKREASMTAKVPEVRRTLERFVLRMKAFALETHNSSSFWVGCLKHKDLLGQEVGSQVCPDGEDEIEEEEEEEDDENAAGGEDGDEAGGGAAGDVWDVQEDEDAA